jgi:hypothetical protein
MITSVGLWGSRTSGFGPISYLRVRRYTSTGRPSAKIEVLVNNQVIFSFYRTVASSVLGVLLTMRIHLRYRKGLFSIGLTVLLLIHWQFLWYRWATLW